MNKKCLLILLLVICFLSGCSNIRGSEGTNYFFRQGTSSWTYEGRFLNPSMQIEQIELSVMEVKHFKEGNLYELMWNCSEDVQDRYGKEDIRGENERGWHEYISVEDNKSEYHGYNSLIETGYYECFVWEIGKGLIEYKSGYGAGSDAIEVYLIGAAIQ